VEKCDPNPCHNNAMCINDRIRFKCLCPNATESETEIVGQLCNESKISR